MKADTLASFPGSPHTQTKNRTERGEPDKIYHARNVIHVGRDNLIPRRVAFKALLWPFLGFAQVVSVLIVVKKNFQNGLPLKHGYVYCQLLIDP